MARRPLSWKGSKCHGAVQPASLSAALLVCWLAYATPLTASTGARTAPLSAGAERAAAHGTTQPVIPAAPANIAVVSGGPAPTVNAIQRYINPTFLTAHTTDPFNSSGGDLIVIYASAHKGVIFTPGDNFGNAWISVAGPTSTTSEFDLRSQIWYTTHPKVGPGHVVTLRLSAAQPLVISIIVVKGSNPYSPLESVSLISSDNRTKSVGVASSAINTTRANDLLLGWAKVSEGAHFASAQGFSQQPGASSDFLDAESGVAAVPGSYNATFTLNKPQAWQSAIMAVTNSPNQATLRWVGGTGDSTSDSEYLVERCEGMNCTNFVQIGATTMLTYNDAGLRLSAAYSYRVRERSKSGQAGPYSSVVSLTIPSARPSLPGNLTATAAGAARTTLSWTPSSENGAISKYLVERCTGVNCNNFSSIATVTGTVYRDTGLMPWSTYNYRVRGIDEAGNIGPGLSVTYKAKASVLPVKGGYIVLLSLLGVLPFYRRLRRALADPKRQQMTARRTSMAIRTTKREQEQQFEMQ